ncbi:hypothetical protein PAEPH01_2784, partial [Pancytospora epiphaga]
MECLIFIVIFAGAALFYVSRPNIITTFFVQTPLRAMEHIMNQPMGIKQNTIIKTLLGTLFKKILAVEMELEFLVPVEMCISIIFAAYSYNMMILRDIFHLLQNKTYNPIKKRIDTIYLDVDQIVLSVFLFSFSFIIYTNLVVYYMYFIFLKLVIEIIQLFYLGFLAAIDGGSPTAAIMAAVGNSFSWMEFIRRIFTGELRNLIY